MSERVRVKVTGLAHNCGRCGADVVPELRDGEPWLSYGPSPVLAESEARRAEAERTIKEMREGLHADCPHKPARLAAERSLAAAVAVLRQVEWAQRTTRLKDGGTIYTAVTCPCCGGEKDPPKQYRYRKDDPPPAPGHAPGCALASMLGGGR